MARQVVWSQNAQRERVEVLKYWVERTGSETYSKKLDRMFRTALRLIAEHPKLGRPTDDPETRMKGVGDYELFYSFTATEVHVLSVWHGKRDPADRPF